MWPQYGVGRPLRRLLTPLYHLRRLLLPDCTGRADFASAGELTFGSPAPYINQLGTPPPRCDGASLKLLTDIR